jgi:hypothetical protein
MIPGIPRIVTLLSDNNYRVRPEAVKLFGKLVDQREFLCVSTSTEL